MWITLNKKKYIEPFCFIALLCIYISQMVRIHYMTPFCRQVLSWLDVPTNILQDTDVLEYCNTWVKIQLWVMNTNKSERHKWTLNIIKHWQNNIRKQNVYWFFVLCQVICNFLRFAYNDRYLLLKTLPNTQY